MKTFMESNTETAIQASEGNLPVPYIFIDKKALDKDLARRERILRYATAKLQAAIARVGDTALQNILICKYFYGFKNLEIAYQFSYCERHVYRLLSEARSRLYPELLKLMPKVKRGEANKTYKFAHKRLTKLGKRGYN